ncbi:hypothetical protein KEGY108214_16975 [Kerstersia gyiorum]
MPGSSFSVSQNFRGKTRINVAHLTKDIAHYFDTKGTAVR